VKGIYWLILGGAFTVILIGMGSFYTLPVFYPIFVKQFGWGRGQVGLCASVILGTAAVSSIIVGRIADRWGPRTSIINGICLTAMSMALMSRIHSLTVLYLACVLLGAGIASFNVMVSQMLMARWFLRRRGLATGLVIGGMGVGGTLGPLFITPIIAKYGFRFALLADVGLLLLIALPIACLVLRNEPADLGLLPFGAEDIAAGAAATVAFDASLTFAEAIRSRSFWCVAACAFCLMFDATSVIQHIVLYMRELHFSSQMASGTLSAILFSSTIGRAGLGILSDVIHRKVTFMVSFALLILGSTMLLLPLPGSGFTLMAILVGLGYGGAIVSMTLTSAEVFGVRYLGSILGVVMLIFNSGGAIGPPVVGFIADARGYKFAFCAALAAAVVGLVAAASITKANGRVYPAVLVVTPE
jgi:OFA family oxalate/formate antiporter-like MFS transporter